jgi:hypothetical protein
MITFSQYGEVEQIDKTACGLVLFVPHYVMQRTMKSGTEVVTSKLYQSHPLRIYTSL